MKNTVSNFYSLFLRKRQQLVRPLSISILIFSLIIGAGYRAVEIKEKFYVTGGFEILVNMASHFWTSPGGYNYDASLKMIEAADSYVFSRTPAEPATGSIEQEKGWPFIISLIIKEGTKGISNIAFTVVRYQLMLDLLVIVLLFFSGKSIIGPLGGSLAAILYALFKPSIYMTSWVVYYYWAIPFSALSIFFWTVLYKPEEKRYSLKYSALLFLLYGMTMGLATSVRLGFLFLPLILSPLIFFRERVFKRGVILLLAMLIGYAIFLVPQILITKKFHNMSALSVRGKWHFVISGLGAYPNPFGIRDTADLTAVNWAKDRGGPDINKVGIQEYDKFMKKEAIKLLKERPDIFIENFKRNIYSGITMTPKDSDRYSGGPAFLGILDSDKDVYDPKILRVAYSFPCLVFLSMLVVFFFWRERFGLLSAVVLQGVYLLGVLCIYFPPVTNHITSYFPVFVLLFAVGWAVLLRGIISLPEGFIRCWVNDLGGKNWPLVAKECFREDWDKEYCDTKTEQPASRVQIDVKSVTWQKIVIIFSALAFFFAVFYFIKTEKRVKDDEPDDKVYQMLNNILRPETSGGFEFWSGGDSSSPDGWQFINGKGGSIHKTTELGKVSIGNSSAEVRPSLLRNSKLFFNVTSDKLYYFIGQTITLTGWVKSNNKISDKVYMSIYAGIDPSRCIKAYYQNSGEWEKLVLNYKIPDDIMEMFIVLNVDNGANESAYFDGIELKVE